MIGKNRFVETLLVLVLLLLALDRVTHADDEVATPPPPQIEPIDFIDNSRPQQADPTNRRPAAVTPTGWGYAVFSPDSKFVATVSVVDGKESNGEVMIWDVADPAKPVLPAGRQRRFFTSDGPQARCAARL